MNKIIFGTDIDECIVRIVPKIIERFKEEFGIEKKEEDLLQYSLGEIYGLTKEQVDPIINEVVYSSDLEEVPFARDTIKWIYDNCIDINEGIYFITSRSNIIETEYQLLNLFSSGKGEVPFFSDFYATKEKTKADIINDLGIEIFVEDRAKIARDIVANTNCKVLLFDRPWNQSIENIKNIIRVFSWNDIGQFIIDYQRGWV